MSEIKNFDDPLHEQVRDVFVLSCFTAQRYSDISTFNANAIINNRLEFIQKKTDVKVVIPIHPIVSIILKKYNNSLPKMPINNEFNRVIKIVAEKIPSLHAPFTKQITYGRELKKLFLNDGNSLPIIQAVVHFVQMNSLKVPILRLLWPSVVINHINHL